MRKIRSKILSWRALGVFVLCVVLLGSLWAYSDRAKSGFERAYSRYDIAAASQQNAAFTPGANQNPLRESLNQALNIMLTRETSVKQRLEMAQNGLEIAKQLNEQVDEIGNAAPAVTSAINEVRTAAESPGNLLRRANMMKLVGQAQKQMATIEDIRGMSYKANFEIVQICNHIIADKGSLSDAYTTELNADLPAVEEEFGKREDSYLELQSSIFAIQKTHEAIAQQRL